MIPITIECTWSSLPPSMFSREAVIQLPYKLSFNGECGYTMNEEIHKSTITDRTINGNDGKIDSNDIYNSLKKSLPFADLKKIRVRGEGMANDADDLIRDLSEEILEDQGEYQIIVETTLRPSGAWEKLDRLMKQELVDHVCFYMHAPGNNVNEKEFDQYVKMIINGLTGCIMAMRMDKLRTVNLCLVIHESSSMNMIEKILSKIKEACMEDDYYTGEKGEYVGMKGIAMVNFGVALLPVMDATEVNQIVSKTMEQLSINYFDENRSMVIPPVVSRVGNWID